MKTKEDFIVNRHIKGNRLSCIVYFNDGSKKRMRYTNTDLSEGIYVPRCSTKFYPLHSIWYNQVKQIVIKMPMDKNLKILKNIKRNCSRFLELKHSKLWKELAEEIKVILKNVDDYFEEWKKQDKQTSFIFFIHNKHQFEGICYNNSIITVNTAFGKRFGEDLSKDIEKYLNGENGPFIKGILRDNISKDGKHFTACNRKGYDNSVEINNNRTRAWLSREYKDCGNGHYYLLISPKYAVFVEDD